MDEQVNVTLGLHHGGGALAPVFVDGSDECGVVSAFVQHVGDDAESGGVGAFGRMSISEEWPRCLICAQ